MQKFRVRGQILLALNVISKCADEEYERASKITEICVKSTYTGNLEIERVLSKKKKRYIQKKNIFSLYEKYKRHENMKNVCNLTSF